MPKSTTINISMPETLGEFVRQRMARKGYDNTSEYFRQLVREDQRRDEDERVEAMLLAGLKSGKPAEANQAWWKERRAELAARVKKRKPREG